MVTLTNENFKTEITDHQGLVVVMFTTESDPLNREFDKLAEQHPKVKFATVDFETERDLIHRFSIRQLPYFITFLNGKVQDVGDSIQAISAKREED